MSSENATPARTKADVEAAFRTDLDTLLRKWDAEIEVPRKRRSLRPKTLPKSIARRDREEVYQMFGGEVARCECGHLKRDGYVCPHCRDENARDWYIEDEHPKHGF